MAEKISKMYGKPIYAGSGEKIGTVKDVVLNIEEGRAERLAIKKMKGLSRRQLKSLIKDESVTYDRVKSIGDIVLLKDTGRNFKKNKERKKEPEASESTESAFGNFFNQ